MSSQGLKPLKPSKPLPHSSQLHSQCNSKVPNNASSSSPSVSSHLAMVELKQKILTSLSKLADRDTYQIAVSELESTIQTISHDAIPMLLNCLFDSSNDPKPAVKKESIRLLAFVCSSRGDSTFNHLTKLIAQLTRRVKDSDSGVRDACRDAIGVLSAQYLRNEGVVGLFVKPLFEAMGDQNKVVQSGAAMCMAKIVECAADPPPVAAFQKMCPRICKLINNPNFLAKAALLSVVSNLSQVGAISPQNFESMLQGIQECLGSPDWATRKAAAETLITLATHSSNLITDGATSMLTALEGCRFDKIKQVRDGIQEALQLWKKILGKDDGDTDGQQSVSQERENFEAQQMSQKNGANSSDSKEPSAKDSLCTAHPVSKDKAGNIPDKAAVLLKKAPALSDNKLNPEFFQKLKTRGSDDLPDEVVVPRKHLNSLKFGDNEERSLTVADLRGRFNRTSNKPDELQGSSVRKYNGSERVMNGKDRRLRAFDEDKVVATQRESISTFSKAESQSEGESFSSNRGSWVAIQRQLMQLERHQAHLMSMLQDFMGGSHNSMVTLENRVRGLERVVEHMALDLSISSGRRGGSFSVGFEGSTARTLGKYNGFSDYNGKFGRGAERFSQSGGAVSSSRGRNLGWGSDISEGWDREYPLGDFRNGHNRVRKTLDGGRGGWDKEAALVRHGEGPSARSVWQASKDEATLEAIRVAGEEGGSSRKARAAIPELIAEAIDDDKVSRERDPVWASWTNAMDALQVGHVDAAYAEVLSSGDDLLLVKLMDRSGPTIDQLSNEVVTEVLHAVAQFLQEQNLFDICLSWIQQLHEMVLENGPNAVPLPMEVKQELLFNLNEASMAINPHWEGAEPDQLLLQLASAWEIDPRQFHK